MRTSLPSTLFASAVLLAAGAFATPSLLDAREAAQEPAPGQESAAAAQELEHGETHDHSPLEVAMEGLKRGMRALRGGIEDPEQRGQMIEIVQAMQAASLDAYFHCPAPFEEKDAAATARWETDFKKAQLKLCGEFVELELALAEGRIEDASKIYRGLNDHKKQGHKVYDPE